MVQLVDIVLPMGLQSPSAPSVLSLALPLGSCPQSKWIPFFLIQQLFNTLPYVSVTPNHKIIVLLLLNYNFATVMNFKIKR